ncbi:hypothetical protein H6F73_15100 [Microcoleus sp. FACHB-68]|nr:hypothetical protein [Microcoleus sp. FACHB-68]
MGINSTRDFYRQIKNSLFLAQKYLSGRGVEGAKTPQVSVILSQKATN